MPKNHLIPAHLAIFFSLPWEDPNDAFDDDENSDTAAKVSDAKVGKLVDGDVEDVESDI